MAKDTSLGSHHLSAIAATANASAESAQSRLRAALDNARERKTLLWLFIDAPWSADAQLARQNAFEDERVQVAARDYEYLSVDALELPELDAAAQVLVQSLAGRSGWPLNLFLTPTGAPVFGAPGLSTQSLLDCLRQLRVNFELDPHAIEAHAQSSLRSARERDALSAVAPGTVPGTVPGDDEQKKILSNEYYLTLLMPVIQSIDFESGLLGTPQAFAYPAVYRYLLDFTHQGKAAPFALFEDQVAVEGDSPNWGEVALVRLARSSLCDVVGGGFFRALDRGSYPARASTEKLLSENAAWFEVYAQAAERTRSPFLRQVANETLRALVEEFYSPSANRWAAALGAAPEAYELSTVDLLENLGAGERQAVQLFFGVQAQSAVPRIALDLPTVAKQSNVAPADLKNLLASAQKKLRARRAALPLADGAARTGEDNVLATALALGALLRGARALKVPAATWDELWRPIEGTLDDWLARGILEQSLPPRAHWAVARALLAYVAAAREQARVTATGRAARCLQIAELLMGSPDSFPDNVVVDSLFFDLRYDYAWHLGPDAGSLRLHAWYDRLGADSQSPAQEKVAEKFRAHLADQLAHAMKYAKGLGIHGAELYGVLGRHVEAQGETLGRVATPERPLLGPEA